MRDALLHGALKLTMIDLIPFGTGLCANTTFQPHSKCTNDRKITPKNHPKHIQKGNRDGKFLDSLRAV